MLEAVRRWGDAAGEEGFTLIELMVVVLIIGILLAIAIPSFVAAREKAYDRAAQSDLRNALTAEKILYTDTQTFSADVAAGGKLVTTEPNLSWVTTVPASSNLVNTVSVMSADGASNLMIGSWSKAARCFYVLDISSPAAISGIYYAQSTPSGASCPNASTFPALATPVAPHAATNPGVWSLAY